jgi:hypothetical protein
MPGCLPASECARRNAQDSRHLLLGELQVLVQRLQGRERQALANGIAKLGGLPAWRGKSMLSAPGGGEEWVAADVGECTIWQP